MLALTTLLTVCRVKDGVGVFGELNPNTGVLSCGGANLGPKVVDACRDTGISTLYVGVDARVEAGDGAFIVDFSHKDAIMPALAHVKIVRVQKIDAVLFNADVLTRVG